MQLPHVRVWQSLRNYFALLSCDTTTAVVFWRQLSPSCGSVVPELAKEERESGGMFRTGAITPDGLIDEDFEEELGSPSEENPYSDPESEFRDIAKYGIVQVAGTFTRFVSSKLAQIQWRMNLKRLILLVQMSSKRETGAAGKWQTGVCFDAGDDTLGRKVIVFSSCRLPPSTDLCHQKLLQWVA